MTESQRQRQRERDRDGDRGGVGERERQMERERDRERKGREGSKGILIESITAERILPGHQSLESKYNLEMQSEL